MFSRQEHLDSESYIDFDFVGSKVDKKSTSRYMSFVGEIWRLGGVRNKMWSLCLVQKLNTMHSIIQL